MKNGFTLIELLAVIVILAIIALIATPIVLGIINDSKNSATIRSAEFYVDAVKNAIMKKNLELNGALNPSICEVIDKYKVKCDEVELEVEVEGEVPDSGSITFENGKTVNVELVYGNRKVVTNAGGWEASEMREYVNSTIYDAFPEDLKSVIMPTYVVSGHEEGKTENYKTTDKVYLLSTQEVWGNGGANNIVDNDSGDTETRQLDYYKQEGVTVDSFDGAIKQYNGSDYWWWLRPANSNNTFGFHYVEETGDLSNNDAWPTVGVSVAFRIG